MVILIADDEETIAELVAAVVEDAGHRAVVARDGRAALELACAQRPVLLITDLMMPRMTGAELIQAVRAHAVAQGYPVAPVILMTAAGADQAGAAGADAVLLKPFDLERLEGLLHRFLGNAVA